MESLFTELAIAEQENLSGGANDEKYFDADYWDCYKKWYNGDDYWYCYKNNNFGGGGGGGY